MDQIEVPFVCVQNLGYFNLHQFGCYDLFENAGTPAEQKWLVLAPPVYDLPVYAWQGEALAFFDHILRGTDNGYDQQLHVRYWVGVRNSSRPPTLSRCPPDRSPLSSASAATKSTAVLCCRVGGSALSRIDAKGEAPATSLRRWAPSRPTAGAPRGWDPAGASTTVEVAIDSGPKTPLVPGEPVDLRLSLTPAPTAWRRGDTLRFDLASRTDLLRKDPSEGWVQIDLPVPPDLCRNTVHYGGDSWIEVTAVPSGA